jgi:hypothetical protein
MAVIRNIQCVLVLLAILYFMFWDVIVYDNVINAEHGDTFASMAWHNASEAINAKEGKALWNPYPFGGMPFESGLIFSENRNYVQQIYLFLGAPLFLYSNHAYELTHLFLAGIFAYMLGRHLKFGHLPSLFLGCVYMMYPQAIALIQSSHGGKLAVYAFIPLLFLLAHKLIHNVKT